MQSRARIVAYFSCRGVTEIPKTSSRRRCQKPLLENMNGIRNVIIFFYHKKMCSMMIANPTIILNHDQDHFSYKSYEATHASSSYPVYICTTACTLTYVSAHTPPHHSVVLFTGDFIMFIG